MLCLLVSCGALFVGRDHDVSRGIKYLQYTWFKGRRVKYHKKGEKKTDSKYTEVKEMTKITGSGSQEDDTKIVKHWETQYSTKSQ